MSTRSAFTHARFLIIQFNFLIQTLSIITTKQHNEYYRERTFASKFHEKKIQVVTQLTDVI